ncbi:hypothetical protein H4R33_006472 [Dimargaris cristalligena]|uniref:Transmembrane protein 223-domain-containing protein n=1 Tax=Dimargaris cristalligena TaxID=215637 RepID=A0A4P9ZVC6_9FUNG|nr:hypothetical protein H4R33_006472 [Dimargaris cristalligena]RKP37537.1 transmembrane protein 223-domain-containing protein [Dimargaris cristalligena]|eukprot:RKP37537.1 transmembrane protein 223-domain-containing protein [Dimargaris cristalligena]
MLPASTLLRLNPRHFAAVGRLVRTNAPIPTVLFPRIAQRPTAATASSINGLFYSSKVSVPKVEVPQPNQLAKHEATIAGILRVLGSTNRRTLTPAELHQARLFLNYAHSKDIVIYQKDGKKFTQIATIALVVQLLFWLNLAHLAYLNMRVEKPRDDPVTPADAASATATATDTTTTTDEPLEFVLAPHSQRLGVAASFFVVGSVISAMIYLYSSTLVTRVTLRKGSQALRIRTARLFQPSEREYPLLATTSVGRLCGQDGSMLAENGSNHYYLRCHGRGIGYQLDRRAEFLEPRVWNTLFFRQPPK